MLTQCTGMMNHAWDGSRSKATSLFTGANEASAVTHSESECCCGGGASKEPELKTQRELEVAFSILCPGVPQQQTTSSGYTDPSTKRSQSSSSASQAGVLQWPVDLLPGASGLQLILRSCSVHNRDEKYPCCLIRIPSPPLLTDSTPSHRSLLFLTLVNPHLFHESISHCCPPDGCFWHLIVKGSGMFYSIYSGQQRWWRAPAALPKRMEMPHPSRDSMPWKDPGGSSSAHSRKVWLLGREKAGVPLQEREI